ncbi:hypothetical protein ACKFR5_03035 [Corynebacterium marquesiae]|uniref:hypothetical protein n=1 Tax=Corynebacterium marquesiae TaxID=2913503 RepID=UPI0038D23774
MSTPTRLDIIRAHQTLNDLRIFLNAKGELDSDTIKYTMSVIKKALPPKPEPTMADVEWDDDKHYLAEAEHPNYGKVIMLGLEMHGLIDFFTSPYHTKRCLAVERETLTPTGRRYTLTEVQE